MAQQLGVFSLQEELGSISIIYTDTHNTCTSTPRASASLSNLSTHQALKLYMHMHAEEALSTCKTIK